MLLLIMDRILLVGLTIPREALLKNHQLELPPKRNVFNPTTKPYP